FMRLYPRVVVHVQRLSTATPGLRDLTERNLDLVVGRAFRNADKDGDLSYLPIFEDRWLVAAGARSQWGRRRNVDLSDLVDEPWVLPPPECRTHVALMQAFRAQGLKLPQVALLAYSIPLRMRLVAAGRYITVFPDSIRSFDSHGSDIRILPID